LVLAGHRGGVVGTCVVAQDAERLVTCDRGGAFRLWDLASAAGLGAADAVAIGAALQVFGVSGPAVPRAIGSKVRLQALCGAWDGGCRVVAAARAGHHSTRLHLLESR
jgi:hypothetical protein